MFRRLRMERDNMVDNHGNNHLDNKSPRLRNNSDDKWYDDQVRPLEPSTGAMSGWYGSSMTLEECPTKSSLCIPIKTRRRTVSEEDLYHAHAHAEMCDYCMFMRIVGGITAKERRRTNHDPEYIRQNNQTLKNVIQTRQSPVQQASPTRLLRVGQVLPPLYNDEMESPGMISSHEHDEDDDAIFALDL